MLSYAKELISGAERAAEIGGLPEGLIALRRLPLDDFGELMISLPHREFPRLSSLLPRMAAEKIQIDWTGNSGIALLRQTTAFARLLAYNYERLSGRAISDAYILDFGCGYGRIARSIYYYTDPARFYGCDPWDLSINICLSDGMLGQFAVSDYLPRNLPFDRKFNLIYAFSVFTHLSERATRQCLATLADALVEGGLLAITIRPIEYWPHDQRFTDVEREVLANSHRAHGFAFSPHIRPAVDGDITYGDTSMSIAYLQCVETRLTICGIDRTLADPLQLIVFMRRR